uniref:Uncharacterized protein n=1 Tax=viral metagenome TaxID=1070528 RepID=A0A6C0JN19_9ZZZZ
MNIDNNDYRTRYLYSKLEVKQSLLLALLEKKTDEALFWAYELYFSGFKDDAFEYLANIYETIYSFENPRLRESIQKIWDEWSDNPNLDCHLGTIIMTISTRKYQMHQFVETYFAVKCVKPAISVSVKMNLIIRMKEVDLEKYKTIVPDKPRNYLKLACRFPIRSETRVLFDSPPSDFSQKNYYHWLYYCKETPFWIEKITKCRGIINEENRDIQFDDDNKEEFYDEWAIEPDEQPVSVKLLFTGKADERQLSITDFCNKYGASLITKKLKITKTLALTNSITYT